MKQLICYLCDKVTEPKEVELHIGSGMFYYAICRTCHKQNGYTISKDI